MSQGQVESASNDGDQTVASNRTDEARYPVERETIGARYRIEREIGHGGMGVVYLASDMKLKRHVAVKRLLSRSSNMRVIQRRFLREAQTIASLAHFNIVSIYDIGQDEIGHYITMEYVAGPELDDDSQAGSPVGPLNLLRYVGKCGPMESGPAIELMLKICRAMEYAHSHGIIHRDIKPSNILLNNAYEPKLVDFGLARPIDMAHTEEITLDGSLLGTPEYAAPEQWGDARAVDVRADVYALAGVMWFILTAKVPRYFRTEDVEAGLGPPLARALARAAQDRFDTVADFAAALETVGTKPKISLRAETASAPGGDGSGWVCENCHIRNPDVANYCTQCGAYGNEACPVCGSEFRIGTQFCPGCGIDVAVAEDQASVILMAKNRAGFHEYESALETIQDLVAANNAEARRLAKTWRDTVLERRNVLTDLESAISVYNIDKAANAAHKLQKMLPDECLSDSADFDIVIRHSSALNELKHVICEAANRAQDERDLASFIHYIDTLNKLFGEEVCAPVNEQLREITSNLENALTQAGLAFSMNCFARAMEALQAVPPWRHGELGSRRERVQRTCEDGIEERERYIESVERSQREGRFSEAVRLIRGASRFRLPPEHSEIRPAKADMEWNDRIIAVDKALTTGIEEKVDAWVEEDNWEDIRNSVTALQEGESPAWRKLTRRLRSTANREIVRRYNLAVDFERRGRLGKATEAWHKLLIVPPELVPANLLQYAQEYESRRRHYRRQRTERVFQVGSGILVLVWLYYLGVMGLQLWDPVAEALPDVARVFGMAGPVLVHLLLWVGAFLWLRRPKFLDRDYSERLRAMPGIVGLAFLLGLAPVSFILTQVAGGFAPLLPVGEDALPWVPMLTVLALWLLLDGMRWIGGFALPLALGLTLSWLIVGGMALPQTTGGAADVLPDYHLWPVLLVAQALVFLALAAITRLLHPARPVPPEPPDDELRSTAQTTKMPTQEP